MLQKLINLIKKVVVDTSKLKKDSKKSTTTIQITSKKVINKQIIDNEERLQNLLTKLNSFANGKPINNWNPSRFIYRVGQFNLKAGLPYLIQIARNEKQLLEEETFRYSLIFALGRCGDATILPLLDTITKTDEVDYIQRLTLDVYLKLATTDAKAIFTKELENSLPQEVKNILEINSLKPNEEVIASFFKANSSTNLIPFYAVYLLSKSLPKIRQFFLKSLRTVPLKYPYFKTIRSIFKSAEFGGDYEVLGLLAYRLETVGAAYTTKYRWEWNDKVRNYSRITVRPPEVAFSNQTKIYFQKRVNRILRLLGERKTKAYCEYAASILQYFPNELTESDLERRGRYVYDNNRHRYVSVNYQTFKTVCFPFLTINDNKEVIKIQWKNSKYQLEERLYQNRIQNKIIPHIDLWLANPKITAQLLLNCQSEKVAQFALNTLEGHEQEYHIITRAILLQLLVHPLGTVTNYALKQISRFFNATKPDWEFVEVMLNSPNEMVRATILKIIQVHEAHYFNQNKLVELTALSLRKTIGQWFRDNAAKFTINKREKSRVFKQLLDTITILTKEESAYILYQNSIAYFFENLKIIDPPKVAIFLRNDLENVQLFGGSVLLAQINQIESIPEALIQKMMEADFVSVRKQGMELFGAMPVETLLKKKDVLISMAISEDVEIREAVRPIIAKSAKEKKSWAAQLVTFFVPILLQKETYEGLHGDILTLLIDDLGEALPNLSNQKIWKLIQSNYREANLLGMELLQYLDYKKEALADIISLANHEMPTIRQYCFDYFNQNIGRVRYESAEALRLLDTKWEDSRQFGFAFFDQHYKAGDWTPELLVSTCDSTRPDVQEFGKKMMVKFFDEGKGETYLLQLSQHPNVSLQLFATNYLEDFATGKVANFVQLKPYFKTVLCGLYKGGATKKRIFEFLQNESIKDIVIAEHTIEILNEVALTISIRDKAKCIQVLHAIKRAYPELESVLEIEKVA